MLNSLFVNACILIAFLFMGSQLFINKKVDSNSDLKTKISIGILFGINGCLLMFNGIDLSRNMIMDFRLIAVIISFVICGPVSAFITALLIMAFRFGHFGINDASLTALFNTTVLYTISCIIFIKADYKKQFIFMSMANIISSMIWTLFLVKDPGLAMRILLDYTLSTTVVSAIVYFLLIYIDKTKELYLKFKRESSKDYLTSLYNVREFDKLLSESITAALHEKEPLSLLMIDIDFFKKVNDTYGHSSGDLVLKQVSTILLNSCRSFDIISRKGGEEFTVILLDCNYGQALEIAERIRKNVGTGQFIIDKSKIINITVSIGVSSYPDITKDPGDLLPDADNALYTAKGNGRNQVI